MKKQIVRFFLVALSIMCVFTLAACNVIINDNDSTSWDEWIVTTAATCELDGVETRVSKTDSTVIETRSVAALGHDWDTWGMTTQPTCLVAGVETRACKDCGNNDVRPVAALGHKWGEWEVLVRPSCFTTGIEAKVCKHDDSHVYDTRVISTLGHDWSEWIITTAPTCTTPGIETKICRNDNVHLETRSIAALGHDWNIWVVTIEPTATTNGEEMRICRNNKNHIETRILYATGSAVLQYGLINGGTEYEVAGSSVPTYDLGIANRVAIVIPAFYNGKPVTSIGYRAFRNNSNIVSVTFAEGSQLESIGDEAFMVCSFLASVAPLPAGLKSIGQHAFDSCNRLTSITIPVGLESIGQCAFSGCSRLASITTIPASVSNIGIGAFMDTFALTAIYLEEGNSEYLSEDGVLFNKTKTVLLACPSGKTGSYIIPQGVTRIENYSFRGSYLTSITIPDCVTSIGAYSMDYCRNLTAISIPKSVITIEERAFGQNSKLSSIIFEENSNLLSIGMQAFIWAPIQSITFPEGLLEIGIAAFDACPNLASISIPSTVTSIGHSVFSDCPSLIEINVDSANTVYSSINGVLFNKAQTTLLRFPAGKAGSYEIPESVITIGDGAFENCIKLTSVTIPTSVTSIGITAFVSCTGMATITIPSSVIHIGSWAFGRLSANQTIYVQGFASKPSGWDSFWNRASDAVIVWSA